MNIKINPDYITNALVDLVKIDSVNPSLIPDGGGEAEIGAYVAKALTALGLQVTAYDLGPKRANVFGRLPGAGGGRSLLLNAHMDTVGVDGMADPFSAEIRDGRLYGRGSQDMKGSLAAMLGATKALIDGGHQLAGDLLITAVADEEYASIGMEHLVDTLTADAAIVTEPTDLTLCRAHRGFIWYEVETIGRAAHGSRFNEGIDANMRMGRFLARLEELERDLRQRPPHPLAGPPSLHAAILRGGSEVSVYAASSHLTIERRIIPGETQDECTAELQAIVDQLAAEDESFKATVRPTFLREAHEIAAAAPIVQTLDRAMAAQLGAPPRHSGQTFWTDAALLAAAGVDTVLLGPTGQGLHSAEEWVDLASVHNLAAILAQTAVDFCG